MFGDGVAVMKTMTSFDTSQAYLSDTSPEVKISFGYDPDRFGGDEEVETAMAPQNSTSLAPISARAGKPLSARNAGLGFGVGGQLAKSALGGAAYQVLDPAEKARQLRYEPPPSVMRNRRSTRLPASTGARFAQTDHKPRPWVTAALKDDQPASMFQELVLSDQGWATQQDRQDDLHKICEHRWTFPGALELAKRGRSFSLFVRCLLDLQRNVQIEEEGTPLDPDLVTACKLFVNGQCNLRNAGDMYQLLTHFTSNAVVFDEWDRYLSEAFGSSRAIEESFLAPHLDQVWARFCRLLAVLEEIFSALNTRFVVAHRLPQVGDLLRAHMKRRCFSKDAVLRNYMFMQEKCSNETIKQIKRDLGLNL